MKVRLIILFCILVKVSVMFSQLTNRGCGTVAPDAQYDLYFQQKVVEYLNQNISSNKIQNVFQIPVIVHVIHGGEAVGVFPNLNAGQINSQIQVLNDDYAGIGLNANTYPANAFQAYATNTVISGGSKDGLGRIAIINTDISFCLALKDSTGNILPEPGIERINWNSISGANNPTTYTTASTFMNFMNTVVKPATIWNPSKYLNIWLTDINTSMTVLAFTQFPPLSGLTGIPSSGSSTTDGLWVWAKCFGSQNLFPSGVYNAPYNQGRTATHELSHYFGVRHTWGDGSCVTDYCNDTPPQQGATYSAATYPYLPNNCTSSIPPTGPEGIMFMNFADFSEDALMYMFTKEQKDRMQTAMINSPYRNQLGTHGLCNSTASVVADFSINPSSICQGGNVSITDMSSTSGSITSWNYSCPAATPSVSTLQNPTFTFNTPGTHTIQLTVTSSGNNSTATHTLNVFPTPNITANHLPILPICAGKTATINLTGALTFTTYPGNITASTFTVNPTATTIYSIAGSSPQGCIGYARDTIKVNPLPNILTTVSSNTTCLGGIITFSNSGGSSFTLTPTGLTGNVINAAINTLGTNVYTVSGTSPFGCLNTRTVSITSFSVPVISISPSITTICSGKSSTLVASGANTYTWNTGFVGNPAVVTPTSSTIYSLFGKNSFGCESSSSSTVNVVPIPVVSIASPSTNVCFGYTMNITANGANTYQWFNGLSANTISVQPILNTTYSVVGTNASLCSDTGYLSITVLPLPTVVASADFNMVCAAQTVALSASGNAINYLWQPGNLFGANHNVQLFTPTTFTLYGQGFNGCAFFNTIFIDVRSFANVNPISTPNIVCPGDSARLSVIGGTVPAWSGNPIPNTEIVNPITNTSYTVYAIDANGCSGDLVFNVSIDPNCDLITYNGFTPNGDGVNDYWIIDNIQNYPHNKVMIYNRWGNKVYETNAYNNNNNRWDGKLNGKTVSSGTYFFIVLTGDGKLLRKGWIEITN